MTTKDSQVVMPEFVSVTLYSKRDLEDMTKLRILTWGDYPGLSGWASKCDLGVHYEGVEGGLTIEKEAGKTLKPETVLLASELEEGATRNAALQSDLQSCPRITVCYFKPQVCSSFFTVDIGN